jgi:thiol-disulfide isomerase/thioredoxin
VSAVGAGTATISASYQGGQLEVDVSSIAPESIEVKGPRGDVKRGETFSLDVRLIWSDESAEDLPDGLRDALVWESTTGAAQVEDGEVMVTGFGQVEIIVSATTELGATITGSWGAEVPCVYPDPTGRSFNTNLTLNTVIPPIKWVTAYSAMDGSTSEFSMEEIYCSDDYSWVKTITFMVTAGWCTACPAYMREVADLSDDLLDAGGIVVYVEVQDTEGAPADGAFAQEHLSAMLGSTNGYFVGDMETEPLTRFFGRSSAIEAFPDAYVVRRSDMMVMTSLNLNRQAGVLPFVEIAQDPTADWSMITAPPPPPFESICEDGDDEVSEPNDDPMSAGALEPGVHSGGICNENSDYYSIETEGGWRFRIEFSHNESDIDIAAFEPGAREPSSVSNGYEDVEELTGTGPAVILVRSYTNTSTLYTVTLEVD